MGSKIFSQLEEALKNSDPEIERRAARAIAQIKKNEAPKQAPLRGYRQ